jgi:hypothetical protein
VLSPLQVFQTKFCINFSSLPYILFNNINRNADNEILDFIGVGGLDCVFLGSDAMYYF